MRYSLLTALLVLTVIAISVSHWKVSVENQELRTSLALVREQQRIEVKNPKNAYVRHVPSGEPDVWMFRVYLPPGDYGFRTFADQRHDNETTLTSTGEPFRVSCRVSMADGIAIWKLPFGEVHTSAQATSGKPATKQIGRQVEFGVDNRLSVLLDVPLVGGETGVFTRKSRPTNIVEVSGAKPVDDH